MGSPDPPVLNRVKPYDLVPQKLSLFCFAEDEAGVWNVDTGKSYIS